MAEMHGPNGLFDLGIKVWQAFYY